MVVFMCDRASSDCHHSNVTAKCWKERRHPEITFTRTSGDHRTFAEGGDGKRGANYGMWELWVVEARRGGVFLNLSPFGSFKK